MVLVPEAGGCQGKGGGKGELRNLEVEGSSTHPRKDENDGCEPINISSSANGFTESFYSCRLEESEANVLLFLASP